MWIGIIFGGTLTAFLMSYRVKSAIIIGIALVSILSWPYLIPVLLYSAWLTPIGATHPLPTFPTHLTETACSTSSNKWSLSTQSSIPSQPKTGTSLEHQPATSPSHYLPSFTLILSTPPLPFIPWPVSLVSSILRQAISLAQLSLIAVTQLQFLSVHSLDVRL